MDNLVTKLTYILRHPELGNRAIARQIGISHNTVARYRALITAYDLNQAAIDRHGDAGLARMIRSPAERSFIEPVWDDECRKLQRGMTRHKAWCNYQTCVGEDRALSYRSYCARLQVLIGTPEPTMRLVHIPGEAMMVDYAGDRPKALGPDGGAVPVELFVATLPNSGYTFACVSRTQSSEDWLWANALALEFFGGVPRKIISDNLKAAVLSCPPGKPQKITPSFAEFCNHYGTLAAPTRPRRPRDKGSVEAHVKIVQREVGWVLADLPLLTIDEINQRMLAIVDRINDQPIRRLITEKRRVLFETYERSELAPLPEERFAYFTEKRISKVPPDHHITLGEVAYSVPSTLVGRAIRTRQYHNHVEFWHNGQQVASHARIHIPGHRETMPQHLLERHRKWADRDTNDLVAWAVLFGVHVEKLVEIELCRNLRGAAAANQALAIKRLPREFGTDAFISACQIAAEKGRPTLKVVRNILENNSLTGKLSDRTPRSKPPQVNSRGSHYYDVEGGQHA